MIMVLMFMMPQGDGYDDVGGDEETMYDVAPAVAGSSSNGASAQPTNPFTRQQYQQVPTNSTNPFAKM